MSNTDTSVYTHPQAKQFMPHEYCTSNLQYGEVDASQKASSAALCPTQDDYIMATIELYLDIINLFLYILDILVRMSGDSR